MITAPLHSKETESKPIRVIVADDSPSICRLLMRHLESGPGIRVVTTVNNGKEAVESVRKHRPDVLTLDIDMPVLSGIDALRIIMTDCPTAVILISGLGRQAARLTEEGLALGALDFMLKYSSDHATDPDAVRKEIIAKVKAAARVKVIRSIPTMETRVVTARKSAAVEMRRLEMPAFRDPFRLVVVGASTGGPLALRELLSALGRDFPFAIVIVQHMPPGFTAAMAAHFDRLFPFPVREAGRGDWLRPGAVLVAPGDRHLVIDSKGRVFLSAAAGRRGYVPSIDVTMESAAQRSGRYATGVLLSGMGGDGVQGLKEILSHGGRTFAQSRETCVIDSMPAAAIERGVAHRVGSPAQIADWLSENADETLAEIN
jgi:two-component system chemotaxis response regulator CheB